MLPDQRGLERRGRRRPVRVLARAAAEPLEPVLARLRVAPKPHHRARAPLPREVHDARRVARRRGDLRADTEVAVVRLHAAARGEVVDVLDHLGARHPHARVQHAQLRRAEPARVHGFVIPHDDTSTICPLHRLHRVDRELADELVRRAVLPQPFEEERHVADFQFEGGSGVVWVRFRISRHVRLLRLLVFGVCSGGFYPGTWRECAHAWLAGFRGRWRA